MYGVVEIPWTTHMCQPTVGICVRVLCLVMYYNEVFMYESFDAVRIQSVHTVLYVELLKALATYGQIKLFNEKPATSNRLQYSTSSLVDTATDRCRMYSLPNHFYFSFLYMINHWIYMWRMDRNRNKKTDHRHIRLWIRMDHILDQRNFKCVFFFFLIIEFVYFFQCPIW